VNDKTVWVLICQRHFFEPSSLIISTLCILFPEMTVGVHGHARKQSTFQRVARCLALARAKIVAPSGIRHDDVDAERGEELDDEDGDLDRALLERLLLILDRLQGGGRGPVNVAVQVLDAARGADDRPEEGGLRAPRGRSQ
jgi:hypothetical protein